MNKSEAFLHHLPSDTYSWWTIPEKDIAWLGFGYRTLLAPVNLPICQTSAVRSTKRGETWHTYVLFLVYGPAAGPLMRVWQPETPTLSLLSCCFVHKGGLDSETVLLHAQSFLMAISTGVTLEWMPRLLSRVGVNLVHVLR